MMMELTLKIYQYIMSKCVKLGMKTDPMGNRVDSTSDGPCLHAFVVVVRANDVSVFIFPVLK